MTIIAVPPRYGRTLAIVFSVAVILGLIVAYFRG
jgi:hypothetical protein